MKEKFLEVIVAILDPLRMAVIENNQYIADIQLLSYEVKRLKDENEMLRAQLGEIIPDKIIFVVSK